MISADHFTQNKLLALFIFASVIQEIFCVATCRRIDNTSSRNNYNNGIYAITAIVRYLCVLISIANTQALKTQAPKTKAPNPILAHDYVPLPNSKTMANTGGSGSSKTFILTYTCPPPHHVPDHVLQALDSARDSPDLLESSITLRETLEEAIANIWDRIVKANPTYVMTRDEFAVFNFFQERFRDNPIAVTARRLYWENLSVDETGHEMSLSESPSTTPRASPRASPELTSDWPPHPTPHTLQLQLPEAASTIAASTIPATTV